MSKKNKNGKRDNMSDEAIERSELYNALRREHFLSESLIYFLGSAFVMVSTTHQTSRLRIYGDIYIPWVEVPYPILVILSILLAVLTVALVGLSLKKRHSRAAHVLDQVLFVGSPAVYLFFVYEWVTVIADLIEKQIAPWYVNSYIHIGNVLIMLLTIRLVTRAYRVIKSLSRSRR